MMWCVGEGGVHTRVTTYLWQSEDNLSPQFHLVWDEVSCSLPCMAGQVVCSWSLLSPFPSGS